jgi:hypothetical protein
MSKAILCSTNFASQRSAKIASADAIQALANIWLIVVRNNQWMSTIPILAE